MPLFQQQQQQGLQHVYGGASVPAEIGLGIVANGGTAVAGHSVRFSLIFQISVRLTVLIETSSELVIIFPIRSGTQNVGTSNGRTSRRT
jgi:hypothetical protein